MELGCLDLQKKNQSMVFLDQFLIHLYIFFKKYVNASCYCTLLMLHTHIVMFLEFFFDSHGCVYFDPKQLRVFISALGNLTF